MGNGEREGEGALHTEKSWQSGACRAAGAQSSREAAFPAVLQQQLAASRPGGELRLGVWDKVMRLIERNCRRVEQRHQTGIMQLPRLSKSAPVPSFR